MYEHSDINWLSLLQHGRGEIKFFEGVRPQRGAGIGGVFKRLMRLVPSILSSPVGASLVSAGKTFIDDVAQGASVADAAKSTARSAVKKMIGVGKRKRRGRKAQIGKGRVLGFVRGGPKKRGSRRVFLH